MHCILQTRAASLGTAFYAAVFQLKGPSHRTCSAESLPLKKHATLCERASALFVIICRNSLVLNTVRLVTVSTTEPKKNECVNNQPEQDSRELYNCAFIDAVVTSTLTHPTTRRLKNRQQTQVTFQKQ